MSKSFPKDAPGRLAVVGEALYGKSWRRRLAQGLKISRTTLHCWLCGMRTGRDIDGELIALLDAERSARVDQAANITVLRNRLTGGSRARAF